MPALSSIISNTDSKTLNLIKTTSKIRNRKNGTRINKSVQKTMKTKKVSNIPSRTMVCSLTFKIVLMACQKAGKEFKYKAISCKVNRWHSILIRNLPPKRQNAKSRNKTHPSLRFSSNVTSLMNAPPNCWAVRSLAWMQAVNSEGLSMPCLTWTTWDLKQCTLKGNNFCR